MNFTPNKNHFATAFDRRQWKHIYFIKIDIDVRNHFVNYARHTDCMHAYRINVYSMTNLSPTVDSAFLTLPSNIEAGFNNKC